MDIDARIQLFDFKTRYRFQTVPQICNYNMPMYSIQTEPGQQVISSYPVYQGFTGNCQINGIDANFYTENSSFNKAFPNYIQSLNSVAMGDGVTTTFQFNLPFFPAIPGHVDTTGIVYSQNNLDPIFATSIPYGPTSPLIPFSSIHPAVFINYSAADGSVITITDSGIFLRNGTQGQLYGLLINSTNPGSSSPYPYGYSSLGSYSTNSNTVNYMTGEVNVSFPVAPLANSPIQVQCYFFQQGIPRAVLFYNNCLTLLPPPNIPYLVELDAYLTPAAFLSTSQAIQFGYMCEYIARGAARKILSDTGDIDQFQFYEPLFREQEILVWKRSQRQLTATRTPTIYSQFQGSISNFNNNGQGAI